MTTLTIEIAKDARAAGRGKGSAEIALRLSVAGSIILDELAVEELKGIVASLALDRRLQRSNVRPREVRDQLRAVADMTQKLRVRIETILAATPASVGSIVRETLAGDGALTDMLPPLSRLAARAQNAAASLPRESYGRKAVAIRRAYVRQLVAFYEARGRKALLHRNGSGEPSGPFFAFVQAVEEMLPRPCRAESAETLAADIERATRVVRSPGKHKEKTGR